MGYVDVLIPGILGLLLVALPTAFTKRTGDVAVDGPRQKKCGSSRRCSLIPFHQGGVARVATYNQTTLKPFPRQV
jgi:hypothetical protein